MEIFEESAGSKAAQENNTTPVDSAPESAPAEPPSGETAPVPEDAVSATEAETVSREAEPVQAEFFAVGDHLAAAPEIDEASTESLRAVIEAIVYVAEEPVTAAQIAGVLGCPAGKVQSILNELIAAYSRTEHGIMIREVAGGFQLTTKPEHHDTIRAFVKSLKAPMKLSLPALETLAVIAYKQPVTAPEIQEIRGVQGVGVLKTLLDRKLITTAGRKNVVGRPILYRTTKEFLVQFGLKNLSELPTLKEFEDLNRLVLSGGESAAETPSEETVTQAGVPEAVPVDPGEQPDPAGAIQEESKAEDGPQLEPQAGDEENQN